jgi:hypothetical protein
MIITLLGRAQMCDDPQVSLKENVILTSKFIVEEVKRGNLPNGIE